MGARRILRIAALAVGIPIALVSALAIGIDTAPGKRFLLAQVATLLAADGLILETSNVEGSLWGRLAIGRLDLADASGSLIEIEQAVFEWTPGDLFGGELHVETLSAARITIDRLPESAPAESQPSNGESGLLPELPVDLAVDRIAIERLVLGDTVPAGPAEFTLQAGAQLEEGARLALQLDAERIDGQAASAKAGILFDLDANQLEAKAELFLPEGGNIQQLIGLDDAPALRLSLDGSGPLDSWQGRFVIEGGEALAADLALGVRGDGPWQVSADGTATVAAYLPADWRFVAAPAMAVTADVSVDEEGALTISVLTAESGALDAQIQGTRDADGILDLAIDAETRPDENWQRVAAPLDFDAFTIAAHITGTEAEPAIDAAIRIDAPSLEQGRADAMTVDGRVSLADETVTFDISGRIEAPASDDAAVGGLVADAAGAPTFSAHGRYSLTDGALDLESARVEFASGRITTDGTVVADPLSADLALTGDIDDLAVLGPLTGMDLAGRASLQGLVRTEGGKVDGLVTLLGSDLGFGDPTLDGLVGGALEIAANATLTDGSQLELADLTVDASGFDLAADASLDLAAETIDGKYALSLQRLAPLTSSVAGSLSASGTVGGSLGDPSTESHVEIANLVSDGQKIGSYKIDATLANLASALNGKISATGDTPMGALQLTTGIALHDERIELASLDLAVGGSSRIAGNLAWLLDAGIAKGRLDLRIERLQPFGAPAGLSLGGGFAGTVELDDVDSAQRIRVDGTAASLSVDDITADTVALDLAVTLGEGAPVLSGTANGAQIVAGPAEISQFSLQVDGTPDGFEGNARATGQLDGKLDLDTGFAVSSGSGGAVQIRIDRFGGTLRDESISLGQPLTLDLGDGRIAMSDLAVDYGPVRIEGRAEQNPDSVSAALSVADLPVAWIGSASGLGVEPVGTIALDLRMSGTPAAPIVDLGVDIAGLAASKPRFRDESVGSARIDAHYAGGRIDLTSQWSGLGNTPAEIDVALPMTLSLDPFAAELPPQGALDGSATWNGDIRYLLAIAPIDPHRLAGQANIDLALAGTIAAPIINGSVTITDGRYENLTTGTLLSDLDLTLQASGRNDLAFELSAGDGSGGKVAAQGTLTIDPARGMPFDVTANLQKAVLVRQDIVKVKASGDVQLSGTTEQASLTGTVTIDKLEGRIDAGLPPSITKLDVTEINAPGNQIEEAPPPEKPAVPFALSLDVNIDIPGRAYLRGRGLESEWHGRLHVTGTANEPRIVGELSPRRGTFTFADKTFDLTDSRVTFDGSPDVDPRLDISAITDTGDVKAIIRVTGRASNPEFDITSRPPLPEDEVLSRLLFGRNSGELSPVQAIQLAQAARTLTSGGGGAGILGTLRKAIGVDVLTVGEGADGAELEIGQRLSENVQIGVQQNLSTGTAAGTVEIELNDNITLDTELGGTSSKVGISWGYDY